MKLQQYYEAETFLLRLNRRRDALVQQCAQANYDLRSSKEALLNYEGGIRALIDKLSGKREEKAEVLRRQVRQQEAKHSALLREKEAVELEVKAQTEILTSFPPMETLRETVEETQWASLEAAFCAEALLPLLEKNREALLEYRALMRGERLEILSVQEQQEIYAEPNVWAEACRPLLLRLKAALDVLRVPFELGSYYESPAAYLVSAAAKHNRLDRVNRALDQVDAISMKCKRI